MPRFLAVMPAVLLLALPAGAGAAPTLVADEQLNVASLALQGEGALWIGGEERSGSEGKIPLLRGAPGRPAERIATVGGSTTDGLYTRGTTPAGLTASATHAAFATAGYDEAASKYGFNDPLGTAGKVVDLATRRVTEVSSCDAGGAMAVLDGTLLATSGCASGSGSLLLRDLARPADAPATLAGVTGVLDVAGHRVAWFDGTDFVVRDVDAGTEVLRLPAAALPGLVQEWQLQADGKLAFALAPSSAAEVLAPKADTIAWVAPGDTQPKLFPQPRAIRSLRIAGDRIAFVRGDPTASPTPPLNEAVVLDLAGREHVAARFPRGGAFDFDGTRVAFTAGTCTDDQVWIAPAGDPDTAELTVEHCPAQVVPGDTRVNGRGRLRVRIACPLPEPARATDACRIRVTVRAGRTTLARGSVRIKAGEDRVLRLATSRRLLRTRPRRVTIELRSTLRGAVDRTRVQDEPSYPRRR